MMAFIPESISTGGTLTAIGSNTGGISKCYTLRMSDSLSISSAFNTYEILSLYKVYPIQLDTKENIESNIVAKNQANAQVKSLLAEKITEPDDYFCHVVHICRLPEIDD